MTIVRVVDARGYSTPEARSGIVYVGRGPFAGFPGHPLASPFKPEGKGDRSMRKCIEGYKAWLMSRSTLDARRGPRGAVG